MAAVARIPVGVVVAKGRNMATDDTEQHLERDEVERFLDRWMNDESFGDLLRSYPREALESLGMEVFDEQVAYFKDLDVDLPVEELRARIAKGISFN